MAIFHLSVKTLSRAAGRSATAAAAYRSGVEITDERTGEVHDYRRRSGVEGAELVLPDGAPSWASNRAALWNAAEGAEVRKNSTVAREFEIALPAELSDDERRRLAIDFARELVERHRCAADVAIHAPGKEGDQRNHHAHILLSTRRLEARGFTEKTRELDGQQSGRQLVAEWRERFAVLQNERLREAGIDARVDHRSLKAQGIEREPTRHLGPSATGFERRTGQASRKRQTADLAAVERLRRAQALGQQERDRAILNRAVLDTTGQLRDALRERDQLRAEQVRRDAAEIVSVATTGIAGFREQFEARRRAEQERQRQIEERERQQRAIEEARRQRAIELIYQRRQERQEREQKPPERDGPGLSR